MAELELRSVSVVYDKRPVLDQVSLTVKDGELLVLVGPSGCGKTTALRVVAGLLSPSAGRVYVDGEDVTDVPPADRDLAMVFQSYALYPHMTVRQNMAFGLRLAHNDRRDTARRVERAAAVLGLAEVLDRRPRQLSGGQRQRVAMGRAIVRAPRAFLMDEPLSNLDAKLRVRMRAEIARIQRSLGTTTVYVTHDQTEAMTMADRIVVLNDGVPQQIGTPQELFTAPANVFVAAFIGSPPTNFLPGRLVPDGDTMTLRVGADTVVLPAGALRPAEAGTGGDGTAEAARGERDVLVGVRPHDAEAGTGSGSGSGAKTLTGTAAEDDTLRIDLAVDLVERLGTETLAHGEVGAGELHGAAFAAVAVEDEPRTAPDRSRFTAALPPRLAVAVGDTLPLRVPRDRILLFDAETGAALVARDRALAPA